MGKVVITGLGVVSPIGCDIDTFWSACLSNQSNVQAIPEAWNNYGEYKSGIWSPLPKIDFRSHGFSRLDLMQKDPVSLLALMATNQAILNSGIESCALNGKNRQFELKGVDSDKAGVFIGTAAGGVTTFLENNTCHMLDKVKKDLLEQKVDSTLVDHLVSPSKINPFVVSMLMANAVSASIGVKYSLHGMNRSVVQACSSSTSAIGYAYQAIKSGQIDFAICGGAEYLYDDYGGIYKGYDIARVLADPGDDIEKANRPFDKDRSGFLYSQGGSGILILETESRAKKRNAKILAQVSSFAETFDAYSMMSIDPAATKIKHMIYQLLKEADLNFSDIDYINAHGTGTKLNDDVESKVIDELFSNRPLVNSSKSLLGHGLGVSGSLEAIISTLSLQHQTTHRCKNLENPVRELNFVTEVKERDIRHVISESFAFGGHNSSLIISDFDV